MNCTYPSWSVVRNPIIGEGLWRPSSGKHYYYEAKNKKKVQRVQQCVSVDKYSEKKKKKGLETPEAPCMLHISRFTIHHISFPLFFLFDEQVFLLTEGAAGLHNNLLPLDQLENYSAHEILYTSASSITVKKKSISLLLQICRNCGGGLIYFLVLTVIS